MKKVFMIMMVSLLCIPSFAQDETVIEVQNVKGPYITNGFWDNWFVTAGGGVQIYFGESDTYGSIGKRLAPALDISVGHVNVIWQGDANEYAIRSLLRASSPPTILNVTGPETLSVRWLANEFGRLLGKTPVFEGVEQENALLNNASKAHKEFGYPRVSIREMIEWTATWVANDGETINKPTHFQERKGQF